MDQPTEQSVESQDTPSRRFSIPMLITAAVLVFVAVAGVFSAFRFVESERERVMQEWQVRLGIVADSRAAALNDWLDLHFATLRELAQNESLQLYMSELALADGDASQTTDPSAQAGYLRNLLVATAERTGFSAPPPASGEVAANIERVGVAGIGLVSSAGNLLVASQGMPPITPRIRQALAQVTETAEPALVDLYLGGSNEPTMGFLLPVFALQGDDTEAIGAIIGLRVVGNDLYGRLKQPGETSKSAESYLVRHNANVIEFLSPLANGRRPLELSIAADTPHLVAVESLAKPGSFSTGRDYNGTQVLAVSRGLQQLPWVLIRKVDRQEALASTETRLKTILVVFILIIVGVTVAIIAVWRHGTSLRTAEAAEKFRIAADRFSRLSHFMRLVTDSQPTEIVAVDMEGNYTFANAKAARNVGMTREDITGKSLLAVLGPTRAHPLEEMNKRALQTGEQQSTVQKFEDDDGHMRVVKSDHIVLKEAGEQPSGCLMILDDITELTEERARRESILRQLVGTLVGVVDRRDPYSAHHSARVVEVSKAIANEIGCDEIEVNTVDIASNLMNLGKILIPSELLTKTGELTPEERRILAEYYMESADILSGVDFDGPVVEAIRQLGERWDGSGPLGVREQQILRPSRIIAVANTFVGMLSPRAYRDAMTFEKVSTILLEDSGTKFDRGAVSALINVLENRGGRTAWAHFREKPIETS